MRNRFVNLVLQDLVLDFKIMLTAILAAVVFFMCQGLYQKEGRIADNLKEQRLQLTQDMVLHTQMLEAKSEGFRNIKASLKGIVFQNGVPSVLIGKDIYQKNDTLNGFTILGINFNSVVFRDDASGQKAELYLHE